MRKQSYIQFIFKTSSTSTYILLDRKQFALNTYLNTAYSLQELLRTKVRRVFKNFQFTVVKIKTLPSIVVLPPVMQRF